MKTFFLLSILTCSFSSFANEFLNGQDLQKLEFILIKEQQAIIKNPECVEGRGAAACLSPFDNTVKEYLGNKSSLSKEEMQKLGSILIKEQQTILENPECVEGRGASACLSPFNITVKEYLENKAQGYSGNI